MPLIGRIRVSLALEHMSQMPAAVAAHNLRSLHTKCAVCMPCDRAGHGVEEGGPAATRFEFLIGGVEGCLARGAGVDAFAGVVLVVLAREGGFGPLLADDAELFCRVP